MQSINLVVPETLSMLLLAYCLRECLADNEVLDMLHQNETRWRDDGRHPASQIHMACVIGLSTLVLVPAICCYALSSWLCRLTRPFVTQ